jgi:hypothetical protein
VHDGLREVQRAFQGGSAGRCQAGSSLR